MSVDVRAATPDDIPTLQDVVARAFFTDPVMGWVFRDDDTRLDRLQMMMGAALEKVFLPHESSTTTTELSGAALWAPPGHWKTPDEVVAEMAPVMAEQFEAEELDRLLTFFALMEDEHPAETDHWYLGVLAADPERQGQGIGTACMRPVLERADADGTPAYLESSNERNVPLYERNGFRVTGIIDMPSGPSLWLMWRDPR
jgi:ribosomal protein S18 acetylase RimI-like enzyme